MIKIQLLSKRKVIVRMKIIDRLYSLLILYTVILVGLCLYEICNGIGTNFPILNKFVQIFGYYWASLTVCVCVLRLAMGKPLKVLPKTKRKILKISLFGFAMLIDIIICLFLKVI